MKHMENCNIDYKLRVSAFGTRGMGTHLILYFLALLQYSEVCLHLCFPFCVNVLWVLGSHIRELSPGSGFPGSGTPTGFLVLRYRNPPRVPDFWGRKLHSVPGFQVRETPLGCGFSYTGTCADFPGTGTHTRFRVGFADTGTYIGFQVSRYRNLHRVPDFQIRNPKMKLLLQICLSVCVFFLLYYFSSYCISTNWISMPTSYTKLMSMSELKKVR